MVHGAPGGLALTLGAISGRTARRSDEDILRSACRGRGSLESAPGGGAQTHRHATLGAIHSPPKASRRSRMVSYQVLTISLSDITWVKRLGEGDYGEVWLCRHEGAKRDMAVKRINKGLLTEESRAAFLQEIKLLSSLRHANLVKVYGACDSPQQGIFLFIELCSGSWRDRLEQQAPISPQVQVSVLRGIANGMAYLHEKGIVHRDLKTANVLLRTRKETDPDYVVVSDMGLARYVDKGGQMTIRGTVWIMAPEMLRHEKYDGAVDVFSFGVLIAESLTRLDAEDIPRTSKYLIDWDELRTNSALQSLDPVADACHSRLLEIATACCQREPSSRPSFKELVVQLEAEAAQLDGLLAPAAASPAGGSSTDKRATAAKHSTALPAPIESPAAPPKSPPPPPLKPAKSKPAGKLAAQPPVSSGGGVLASLLPCCFTSRRREGVPSTMPDSTQFSLNITVPNISAPSLPSQTSSFKSTYRQTSEAPLSSSPSQASTPPSDVSKR
jgi:serine/threonine protein kinase